MGAAYLKFVQRRADPVSSVAKQLSLRRTETILFCALARCRPAQATESASLRRLPPSFKFIAVR